jgi:hypothetical protein
MQQSREQDEGGDFSGHCAHFLPRTAEDVVVRPCLEE